MSVLGEIGADSGTSSPTTSVSILIVDDNSAKRSALKSALHPLGHHLVEAESGFAALRCLLREDFAIILLDLRMPIMDGFETAALIRKRPRSARTPIIFITAYGRDEVTATDFHSDDAVGFLYAPVVPDQLRATIAMFASPSREPVGLTPRTP